MNLAFVHGVSIGLIVVIVFVGIWSNGNAILRARAACGRVDEARGIFEGIEPDQLWHGRETITQRAEAADVTVRNAWREFNESLVADNFDQQVWNTVEAEHFFSDRRFAPKLVDNRVLNAAPTALTTLGLIGTFVGLAFGLNHVVLDGDTDQMTSGIQALVQGAGIGFIASLIGVSMSLITTAVLRFAERAVVTRLHGLHDHIDRLFELRSPEHSLAAIASSSAMSAAALKDLHEKIGTTLQETIGTSLQSLADSAGQQSLEVFTQVGEMFTGAFKELGDQVSRELADAAETMRSTIDYMGNQLASQADQYATQMTALQAATARQIELLDEKLPAVVESIDQAAARIGTASEDMASSSQHLANTASWFEETSGRFNTTLVSSVEIFDRLAARNDEASSALESLATRMLDLTGSTTEAASTLRDSSAALATGFSTMSEHQGAFLSALDARLTRQLDGVTTALGTQSERMSQWLAAYSAEVSTQTQGRMDEWNRHTEGFTTVMLNAVHHLSSAIDELDARAIPAGQHVTQAADAA